MSEGLNSKQIGDHAESEARNYLEAQGLVFCSSNYTCKLGEIDLIMKDNNTLVFVEVRFRRSAAFGGATASLSAAKLKKIRNSASFFLQNNAWTKNLPCRFDVLAITGTKKEWLKGAF